MIFNDFYEDFQEDFGNHPKKFTDTYTGDGSTRLYQLTEKMIAEQSPFTPIVEVDSIVLVENTDYNIDYTLGTIIFTSAPATSKTISFEGYYQKVNLTNLIKYYNRATIKVAIQFPLIKTVEINYTDVSGATEDDEVTEIDLDSDDFNDWDVVKAVYQFRNDFRGVNFIRRERYLMFNAGTGDDAASTSRGIRHNDYGYWRYQRRDGRWVGSLRYPYYLQGIKKYATVDSTVALPLDETIEIPDISKSSMLAMTALFMYKGMYHALQNENATSLRFQKMSEINKMIMSLGFDLKDNRWNEAPGRGHSPDHKTRWVNTNDPNA